MTSDDRIKQEFKSEFKDAFTKVSNNMSVGFGKDGDGNITLEVRLANNTLKNILPNDYRGLKVNVVVVGKLSAQEGK